ncbi:2-amino-4-hydroxy-6-hydroxymethyldihydropteridine diphosphokinase [Aureococcus anophagefferens]|nr:2-amino-4-hydroxy-6-hydroxymethyldihydropteridine diphosphokinase [Aureococcus anophagefferens]
MVADADLEVPHRARRGATSCCGLVDARRALDAFGVPYDARDALADNVLSEPWLRDATLRRVWAPLDAEDPWPRGDRTRVMGILNATPDSFSDGGAHASVDAAVARAGAMVDDGADCLDVGGESTRPGAVQPPLEEELARVLLVVEALRARFPGLPLSVDTRRGAVAAAARAAGATLTNDVSGGSHDPAMLKTLADDRTSAACASCTCGARRHDGGPELASPARCRRRRRGAWDRVAAAAAAGVAPWRVLVDPGVGFARTRRRTSSSSGLGELRRKTATCRSCWACRAGLAT